jgi:hypothetical protein
MVIHALKFIAIPDMKQLNIYSPGHIDPELVARLTFPYLYHYNFKLRYLIQLSYRQTTKNHYIHIYNPYHE